MGEVQEMIEFGFRLRSIADAVRRHHDSERPRHRMFEQWQSAGNRRHCRRAQFSRCRVELERNFGLISATCASGSRAIATPSCALACQKLLAETLEENGIPPRRFDPDRGPGGRDSAKSWTPILASSW